MKSSRFYTEVTEVQKSQKLRYFALHSKPVYAKTATEQVSLKMYT